MAHLIELGWCSTKKNNSVYRIYNPSHMYILCVAGLYIYRLQGSLSLSLLGYITAVLCVCANFHECFYPDGIKRADYLRRRWNGYYPTRISAKCLDTWFGATNTKWFNCNNYIGVSWPKKKKRNVKMKKKTTEIHAWWIGAIRAISRCVIQTRLCVCFILFWFFWFFWFFYPHRHISPYRRTHTHTCAYLLTFDWLHPQTKSPPRSSRFVIASHSRTNKNFNKTNNNRTL